MRVCVEKGGGRGKGVCLISLLIVHWWIDDGIVTTYVVRSEHDQRPR